MDEMLNSSTEETPSLIDDIFRVNNIKKNISRFSDKEKTVLFTLLKEYQQIIDIKRRKSSYSSHKQSEVRQTWDTILQKFNEHSDTTTRTMKQIQKFWLNAKLRKRLPSPSNSHDDNNKLYHQQLQQLQQVQTKEEYATVNVEVEERLEDEDHNYDEEETERLEQEIVELKFIKPSIRETGPTFIQYAQPDQEQAEELDIFGEAANSNKNSSISYHTHPAQINVASSTSKLFTAPNPSYSEPIIIRQNSYENELSALRLQEMQVRVRAATLNAELQEIAVARAREELRQMKELHQIKIQMERTRQINQIKVIRKRKE